MRTVSTVCCLYIVLFSVYNVAPVGPPHSLSANVTSTAIHLSWQSPFDPDTLILSYVITYRLISTSFAIETPRPRVTIANINGTAHVIKSLLGSSIYEVVVFSITEESTGPSSEPMTVTTRPPSIVVTLKNSFYEHYL